MAAIWFKSAYENIQLCYSAQLYHIANVLVSFLMNIFILDESTLGRVLWLNPRWQPFFQGQTINSYNCRQNE